MTEAVQTKPILIVTAMRGEAGPIARRLGLGPAECPFPPAPALLHSGAYQGVPVQLLICGPDAATGMDSIGTQSATLTTALGVRACEPRCILSIGTCGALARKGAEIGDLYLATDRVWYHARRIPLPGWHEYGRGGYPTAGDAELAASIGARAGILSTADSLDFPDLDAGVFESLGADMADMEGAAVAWVAHMHGLPFYALKGVTDLMDSPRPVGSQFQENFAALSEKIGDASLRLIDALIN